MRFLFHCCSSLPGWHEACAGCRSWTFHNSSFLFINIYGIYCCIFQCAYCFYHLCFIVSFIALSILLPFLFYWKCQFSPNAYGISVSFFYNFSCMRWPYFFYCSTIVLNWFFHWSSNYTTQQPMNRFLLHKWIPPFLKDFDMPISNIIIIMKTNKLTIVSMLLKHWRYTNVNNARLFNCHAWTASLCT